MPRLDIRLTDKQKSNLNYLSTKLGVSSSEVVRQLIEYDVANVRLVLNEMGKKRKEKIEEVANQKYTNYLLSNATKNINQIARYVNANKHNNNAKAVENALLKVEQQLNEIKKKMK